MVLTRLHVQHGRSMSGCGNSDTTTMLIQLKMKKIISVIFAIAVAFFGMQDNTQLNGTLGKASQLGKSFCEDEPIIMHSRVRTTAGLPIAGATVSLRLNGTSNPQYSGTTNSSGEYTFDSVAQGVYHYKITATGYDTKNVGLTLTANITRTDTLIAP